jgi:hypothetical protein
VVEPPSGAAIAFPLPNMRTLILLCGLSACAGPSYLVRPEEWSRARDRETIEAENEVGETVRLKAQKLDDAATGTEGDRVRVHPANTRYKVAAGLLTIGAILIVGSSIAALTQLAPCDRGDECWIPGMVSSLTLGTIGGVSMTIGGAMLPSALNDNYAR